MVALVQVGDVRRSGLVISADGLVVTSAAAVRERDTAEVIIPRVGVFQSPVLGRDELADLAVLRVPTNIELTFEELVGQSGIRPGLAVTAVGYSSEAILGNSATVTSATTISIRTVGGVTYIQTDTALDSGLGGGPLVNDLGEVIGINTTAIASVLGQSIAGVGLAVHLSEVINRLDELVAGAHFYKPTPPGSLLPPGSTPQIPPFPNIFSGDVTINGEPAPAGTQVFIRVGRYVSEWVVTEDGRYPFITVGPPDDDGYQGEPVIFYVNGFPIDKGLVFGPSQEGPIRDVDLDLVTSSAS